jgi:VCBS repeat-containing protein
VKHSPHLIRIVPVVVIVAVLAGCAPAVPTHTHSVAAPTATPSPSVTAASAPGSRVPLGCSDLLDQASWQALAGSAAKVDQDENTPATNLESIAQQQYGALACDWDGTYTSSASNPGSELQVVVAPDASTQFESRFATIMADQTGTSHPAATENVAGKQSGYWCGTDLDALGADSNVPICDAEMLVSNFWVSIQVSTVSALTRPQLTAGLSKAMTVIAAKLSAAGPAPAQWVAPATPPDFCTNAASTASVRTIVGDQTLVAAPLATGAVSARTIGLVGRNVSCSWHGGTYGSLVIALLAGGSWALPNLVPRAPADAAYGTSPYLSLSVAGATSPKVSCGGGTCDAFLAVGTTAVEIVYVDPGTSKNPGVLAAFAKDIRTSPLS